MMTTKHVLFGLLVVTLMAACGDKKKSDGGTAGTVATTAGTVATTAGTTATTAGTTATTAGTTATTAGTTATNCSAEAGPATCGAETCTAPDATSAQLLCAKTCCTTDGKCGTVNSQHADCMLAVVNTSSCPNEMILGAMATGCCVDGTNTCGVVDTIRNMGCIARADVPLATLPPKNCDGTTPEATAGTGAGVGAGDGAAAGDGSAGTVAAGTGG